MRYFLCFAAIFCPSPLFAQAGYGDSFGTFGNGNGQFAFPVGISHDTFGGSLFVADSGNARIQWFSTAGQYQSQLGSYGTGNGQFINPRGVASLGGFMLVADTGNGRISNFQNGVFLSHSYGPPSAPYVAPNTIAHRSGGWILADGPTNRVFLDSSFSSPSPTGTAATSTEIFVSGDGVVRVYGFSSGFPFLRTIGNTGSGSALLTSAEAVAVSGTGRVYVADRLSERIAVYTSAGSYLGQFRSPATGFNPAGIAVTNTGLVFVSDFSNHQIARFLAPAEWTANASHTFANLTLSDSLTLTSGKSLNIPGTMTMNAGSSLTVNGGSLTVSTLIVNGSATHTGGTSGGTLVVGTLTVNGTFGSAVLLGSTQIIDTLDVGAGGVATYGFGLAPNRLTGTGQVEVPVIQLFGGPIPFRVGAGNGTSTFAGSLTGSGEFHKLGTGTLTLSGSSSLTGATTVVAGTLNVTGIMSNSAVTVANGATLTGRGGTLARLVTVESGGTITPALDGTTTAILNVTGGLTLQGGGGLKVQLHASGTADRLNFGTGVGRLTFSGDLGNRSVIYLAGMVNPSAESSYILADVLASNVFLGMAPVSTGDILATYLNGEATGPVRLDLSGLGSPSNLLAELSVTNNSLMVRFTPVPEPAVGLILAVAGIGLLARRRLVRSTHHEGATIRD